MGLMQIRCPKTCKPIDTAIDTDYRSLASSWREHLNVDCPHCGEVHTVQVSEAFMASGLSNDALRGGPVARDERYDREV